MALELGELVGLIRADDTGWVAGLNSAGLRLRGLQRDAEGRLSDLRGNFITEGEAAGRGLSDGIRAHGERAAGALKKVGMAAGAIGVGLPAVAAVGAAVGGLAAGAAAAGLAFKAFSLAAGPQMEGVAEVAKLAEDAQKAAAAGSADAAEKQKAYQDALAGLPTHTRAAAKEYIGLQRDHQKWSDSMSSTTMPVYTKGLQILRGLLPMLTPFVKAAAGAIGDFLDRVAVGVKSARFKEWAKDMSSAAGPALSNFLKVVMNLAVGFGGLLQAFLPASAGMTGGLASMTGAFAKWGSSLSGSSGMDQFLAMAREGAQLLGTLAGAAVRLLVALSPLIGVTAQIAMWMVQLINAIPPGVLDAVGLAIAGVVLGMKAWTLATAAWRTAQILATQAQMLFNMALLASPITWIIIGIVALVAAIYLIATRTEWFQTIWRAVWNGVKAAVEWGVRAAITAITWLRELPGRIATWFGDLKDRAILQLARMVIWVRGLPGRIATSLSSMATRLKVLALAAWLQFRNATVQRAMSMIAWVRGLPGRIIAAIGNVNTLLINKGRDIVRGLLAGVKSMGGWLRSQLMSFAKTMIPGPIAKALKIGSPSRLMADKIGRWIPAGVVEGIKSGQGAVDRTMAGLVSTPTPGQYALNASGNAAGGAAGRRAGRPAVLRIESSGSKLDDLILEAMRKAVQVRGGDVQLVLAGRRA